MKRAWTILVLVMIVALPVLGQQKIEQIVARVNNDIILKSDVDREMELRRVELMQAGVDPARMDRELAEQSRIILRDLIDRALLLQIAKEVGLNADLDVEKTMEDLRVKEKYATREELDKAIIRDYGDLEEFKNDIRTKFLTQEVISNEVYSRMVVTQEEMKKYYDENQKQFDRPAGIRIAEITVLVDRRLPDQVAVQRKKIEEALAAVKKGDSFEEVAEKFSEVESAQRGGDQGFIGGNLRDEVNEDIAKALEGLGKGQVTEIIEFNDAFTFFKVTDKHDGGILSFDLAFNEIRYGLLSKQAP
ncbi:MAG TPA: peptidyl-prolyl cis-trans isomerase, partial [Terriglobia bacterium]|nr:peptidyl-prolyl cis-trans isomerase [Terriglobia bacterium]